MIRETDNQRIIVVDFPPAGEVRKQGQACSDSTTVQIVAKRRKHNQSPATLCFIFSYIATF
jgi:hypothetical protein